MNTVFVNSAQLKGLQLQKNGPYNNLQFSSSQQHLGSAMPGGMQLSAIHGHGGQSIGVQLTNAQMGVASMSNELTGGASKNAATPANNTQVGSLNNAVPSNWVQSNGNVSENGLVGAVSLNGQNRNIHLSDLQAGTTGANSVRLNNVINSGVLLNNAQIGGVQLNNGPVGMIPLSLGNIQLNSLAGNVQLNSTQLAPQISGSQLQAAGIAGLPFAGAPLGSAIAPFNNPQLGAPAANGGVPANSAQMSSVQINSMQLSNLHANSMHVTAPQLSMVNPNAGGTPSNGVQVQNTQVPGAQFSTAQAANICLNSVMVNSMNLKKNSPQVNLQQHLNNAQLKNIQLSRAQINASIQRGVMQRVATQAGGNGSAAIAAGSTADPELSLAMSTPLSVGIRVSSWINFCIVSNSFI